MDFPVFSRAVFPVAVSLFSLANMNGLSVGLAQVISSQMASLISSSIDIRLLGYTGISVCRCLLAGVVQYVLMGCQLINCRPLTLQISEVGKTVDVFNAVMLLWRA